MLVVVNSCRPATPPRQSNPPEANPDVPSVMDTPVEFAGSRGTPADLDSIGEVRIGFFVPDATESLLARSIIEGATLAIEQANSTGGLDGFPFTLVRRWDDDPWRGGSKEMIKLVYEDRVWAVVGSVDGTTTHVAEQVVTKAWVPLISPVSADPTLNYIRIPWMFRLPPDDGEQAKTLVRDGIAAQSLSEVGLVTSTDHDGRIFAAEFQEHIGEVEDSPLFHLEIDAGADDLDEIARRVAAFDPGALVVRVNSHQVVPLLRTLRANGIGVPVLLPWIPGTSLDELTRSNAGPLYCTLPFSTSHSPDYAAFQSQYLNRFRSSPSPSAAYSFDATAMLIEAIRSGGLNRADIRDAISEQSNYHGVTGRILWDNAGGNQATPSLVTIPVRE